MNVIEVIPIARGIGKDVLTYFTISTPREGAIVTAELRGRKIKAIVVSVKDAAEHRAELRGADFALKKASFDGEPRQFLSQEFLTAATRAARFYAGTVGGVLHLLVPHVVLTNIDELHNPEEMTPREKRQARSSHILVLQADERERIADYRSVIREEFARGRSVFICVPTAADAIRIKSQVDRGIADYSHIFHSQLRKHTLIETWNKAIDTGHPALIIATGAFFCVPRHDIGTIIVEREDSRSYKLSTRPFVDIRMFAELYAKEIGARLIYGDTLLRTETIWRYKEDEVQPLSSLAFRSTTSAEQHIVDLRTATDEKGSHAGALSPRLLDIIATTREKNEHTFLFAARRGLSPLTLCQDCGTIVTCHTCKAPTVLHSRSSAHTPERFFLCHHCGERRSAEEKCSHCTSWRLRSYGTGIELVAEDMKRLLSQAPQTETVPAAQIFRIDSDTVKTHAKAATVAKKFKEKAGAVLVGTEMAIGYLDTPVENTAIVSIDSMFSIPDFRINEKILSTLLRVRSLATKQFIIQTRQPDHRLFQYAIQGNVSEFYKEELDERERFDYPPFAVLIKISRSGPEKTAKADIESLKEIFADYAFDTYSAWIPQKRGLHTEHMLIKIGRKRWVDEQLLALLRSLPPQFVVEVEPESIL